MTTLAVRSVCPFDCPDTCGLLVEVAQGRALRVSGDPEHPYTAGRLCVKMDRYQETVHSPRRLTEPLIRTGAKGSGAFRSASWDEAIDLIASRWREIIAQSGAEAILPYSYAGTMGLIQRNAGHAFFHRLGASRLDRTICAPAKGAGWEALMGQTSAPHPDTLLESDLIILWGLNAATTSVHLLHRVHQARKRGAKVWLIETYKTPTAAAVDRVFLVRPGSDGALALGLMWVLSDKGLIDQDFLREQVQGFEELKSGILPDYDPAAVSALTGLSAADIKEMALEYGRARAPFIALGSGMSRYGNGAMTVRTICALPALVGAWAKPGGGAFTSTSTGAAFAMNEVVREDFLARPTRIINMNCLGDALTRLDPPVHSLYVYHSNPAAIAPDQNRVIEGLCLQDLFTVVHERFMTDTARYADVVLPATTSLEHSDIYRAYGNYFIQRARPAIPPVGQSRENWVVFCALAKAMGFEEPFFKQSAEELIDHLLSVPRPWREGIDLQALNEGRAVELPLPKSPPWKTSSGKIEILNPALAEPLPRFLSPHGGDYPLRLMTAPALRLLNSSFCERDELRRAEGGMLLKINPAEAASRGLTDGQEVEAFNDLGCVRFVLRVSEAIPAGVVVAEGVWWLEFAPGERSVNALTSQKLTDMAGGSTFYDNTVEVRAVVCPLKPLTFVGGCTKLISFGKNSTATGV